MMGSNRWRELHGFKMESRGGTGAFTTPLAVQGEGGRTEGLARASGTAGGKKATEERTQSGRTNATSVQAAASTKLHSASGLCLTPHEALGGETRI